MSAFSFSLEATSRTNIAQETDEVLAEMADFSSLTQVDFRCGFNFRGQFDLSSCVLGEYYHNASFPIAYCGCPVLSISYAARGYL